jgi:FdhD protein
MGVKAVGSAPTLPASVERTVLRIERDGYAYVRDEVVTEWPLTVQVNGEEFVTLVCSPTHLDELTVGFLHSEGIVESPDEIERLTFDADLGTVAATVRRDVSGLRDVLFARRYVTSCCGKGRAQVYFDTDLRTARRVEGRVTLRPQDCVRLVEELQGSSALFRRTGGVHNACLATPSGVVVARSDIGRHNALDKIYGHCLLNGLEVSDKVVAFSGRVSSEVLLKVAKIGVPVVLSKSAPTELALAMAEDLNITVVGFIRGDGLNVYTHPERILLS